jgi:hypothetical protein
MIMFTDGITTEGQPLVDAARNAREKSIPLFIVGLGSDVPPRDLRLDDLSTEDVAFVGDRLRFSAKLTAQGYTGGAVVRLRRGTDSEILAEQKVSLGDAVGTPNTQVIQLEHRTETPGEFDYVIEVAPREAEANIDNNRVTRRIVVRDDVIRVLLVQAYPSYEFRFLKEMLLRELNANQPAEKKAVGFRTVLQEADVEYEATDKTAERRFPASREELFQYDVLIFGDVNPALLSPSVMNNIYEFVTVRGGGLIFIAGPRYTPLAYRDTPIAALLPMNVNVVQSPDAQSVSPETFRPQLTALGRAHPMLQLAESAADNERLWAEQLPPMRWLLDCGELRPGVRVLAEHPTRRSPRGEPVPVITLQFLGAGKVVFHATDETYRWRLRVGDAYFARYWIQTIRYLCRSPLLSANRTVELTTDRDEYRRGDEVHLRVRFLDDRLAPTADDGVTVVVAEQSEHRRSILLHRHASERGLFEASAGALPDGKYTAWLLAPSVDDAPQAVHFYVAAPPGELARTTIDTAAIREAAKISLGRWYTFSSASKLLPDLPPAREVRVASLPARPIWNSPLVAAIFVSLIVTEWLLRRRVGLP